MSTFASVVDYGSGNVFSVCRAIEQLGATPKLIDSPEAIRNSNHLILPGVGAFENGMAGLRSRGLIEPLLEYLKSGKPFIGLCVGMQMLFSKGEEFGTHPGLDVITGNVSAIPDRQKDGSRLKVPHIGWNALIHPEGAPTWSSGIFKGLQSQKDAVYFVHSYAGHPIDSKHLLATAEYGGHSIVAAVAHENVFGCQFHPERSGKVGLQILHNFLSLNS